MIRAVALAIAVLVAPLAIAQTASPKARAFAKRESLLRTQSGLIPLCWPKLVCGVLLDELSSDYSPIEMEL